MFVCHWCHYYDEQVITVSEVNFFSYSCSIHVPACITHKTPICYDLSYTFNDTASVSHEFKPCFERIQNNMELLVYKLQFCSDLNPSY